MTFLLSHDSNRMDDETWENFLNGTVIQIHGGRVASFDWDRIKQKVEQTPGASKTKGGACNHYVPYSKIKDAIQSTIEGQSLRYACQWLVKNVIALYQNSEVLSLAELQDSSPVWNVELKYGCTPEEFAAYKKKLSESIVERNDDPSHAFVLGCEEMLKQQKRMAMEVWTGWAMESICDYPDNLFYGPGSGDKKGTAVDVPKNKYSRKRVRFGAQRLREAFDGMLRIIDKDGRPCINNIVIEDLPERERSAQTMFDEDQELQKTDPSDEDWDS